MTSTVREVMKPPTTTIEQDGHLAAAAYLMKHSHQSALVMVDDDTDEPLAMITEADITAAVAHGLNLEETRSWQVATTKPVTVQADTPVREAMRLMLAEHLRHLPVVDGTRLVGLVELADLCQVCLSPDNVTA